MERLQAQGSLNPRYYFILDTAKEVDYNVLSSTYFLSLLGKAKIDLQSCRFNFADPFKNPFNKTIPEDKLNEHKQEVFNDIDTSDPTMVVCLGKNAINLFEKVKTMDSVRRLKLSYRNKPLYATHGINYINYCQRSATPFNQNVIKQFISDLGIYTNEDKYKSKSAEFTRESYEVIDISECSRLREIYKDDDKIVLDYEASSLDCRSLDFYISSVGLFGVKSKKGVYVDIASLEKPFVGLDIKHKEEMKLFLESKQFIVYNVKYEWSASLGFFNARLNNPIDILMIGRGLLDGGKLKEVASRRLGILSWNTSIEDYISSMSTIIADLYMTIKPKKEYLFIKDNLGLCNFDSLILDIESRFETDLLSYIDKSRNQYLAEKTRIQKNNVFNIGFWDVHVNKEVSLEYLFKKYPLEDLYADASTKKQYGLLTSVKNIDAFLKNNFPDLDKYSKYSTLLFQLIIDHVDNKTNVNYCEVPFDILAFYNMQDVWYSLLLYESYCEEVTRRNLWDSMQMMINQGNLAAELETNGVSWNEEYAKKCVENYERYELKYLKKFLLLPIVEEPVCQLLHNIKLKETQETLSKRKKITDEEKQSLLDSCKTYRNKYSLQEQIEINSTTKLDVLYKYFNPASSNKLLVKVLSDALITPRIRKAYFIQQCRRIIDYTSLVDFQKEYPVSNEIYKMYICINDKDKVKFHKDVLKFLDMINIPTKSSSRKEVKFLTEIHNYELDSFKEELIQNFFTIFTKFLGVDLVSESALMEDGYIEDYDLDVKYSEFTLEDGSKIVLNKNSIIKLKDGSEKLVGDINIGDDICL